MMLVTVFYPWCILSILLGGTAATFQGSTIIFALLTNLASLHLTEKIVGSFEGLGIK